MNNIDKAILLAEKFGASFTNIDFSYIKDILSSKEYLALINNVKWASNFQLEKAIAIQDDFKSINYDVKSLEASIILATRINYLSSLSAENYYLNPLGKYNFELKTNSIGDLMLVYDGDYHSINYLIKDEMHTEGFKMKVIADKCEMYARELVEKTQADIALTKDNKGIAYFIRKTYFAFIIRAIFSLFAIFASLSVFILDIDMFNSYLNSFPLNEIYTYSITISIVASVINFLILIGIFCYISNFFYPYFYFKHEAVSKSNKIFKKVSKSAKNLALYILQAVRDKKELSNDINLFSTSFIPKEEYLYYKEMYSLKEKGLYQALKYFYLIFYFIFLIGFILSLIYYFINK